MPFPRVVSLIAPPSAIWSLDKVCTANAPVLSSDYPMRNLTDGSMAGVTRFAFGTVQILVDLGAARTPNIFGVLNHNFDATLIVGVSNDAGLFRAFSLRDPNGWIDLRGFPTSSRYWTLIVNSNSVPVSIGQIVIATGVELDGSVESEPEEEVSYPGYRDTTEFGKVYSSMSGAMFRQMPFNLLVDNDGRTALQAIDAEVGVSGGRVLVVPTTNRNDIWLAEWPSVIEYGHPDQLQSAVPLTLVEETGGVLYGR